MNASHANQLRALDGAILALLDERARLLAQASGAPSPGTALDDLLRRRAGPFPLHGVREVFAAIERHSRAHAELP